MARAIPETPRALIRWAREGASKIASDDDEGGDAQQGEETTPDGHDREELWLEIVRIRWRDDLDSKVIQMGITIYFVFKKNRKIII